MDKKNRANNDKIEGLNSSISNSLINKPGYKKTSIGFIPEDWEFIRIKNAIKYFGGNAFKSSDTCDTGIRWLKIANVGINQTKWHEESFLPLNFESKYPEYLLNTGDVVLALTRPILDNKLKITFVNDNDLPALLNQRVGKIIPKNGSSLKFIFYAKQTAYFVNMMNVAMAGTDPPNIGFNDLGAIRIPLPPLKEQLKIAEILSTWDKAIANYELLIKNYELRKKALMQKLLTGKVRFKKFEGQEWKKVRLGEIVEAFSGGTPSRNIKKYYNGKIPWIKSGELNNTIISETEESISELGLKNSSAKIVKPGTILIALYGATAGVVGVTMIEASINQAILAVIPNQSINKNLLFYILNRKMPKIVNNMVQGGQPNLSGSIVKGVYINHPDFVEEQCKIASVLTAQDKQIDLLKKQKDALEKQKKGLMQKLLTGSLRIKEFRN